MEEQHLAFRGFTLFTSKKAGYWSRGFGTGNRVSKEKLSHGLP